jgi:hypothetical protein
MQRSVIYNIIKDGDRHLRGKIAELIFERVKSQLLERTLYCCNTLDLYHFSNYDSRSIDALSINEKSLLSEYMANLNAAMNILGIEKCEVSNALSSEDTRKNLRRLCLFCLKEGETCVHVWVNNHSYRCPFHLCSDCLYTCIKKGLIRSVIFSDNFTYYEVDSKNEAFHRLVRNLVETMNLIEHLNIVEVLSRLDAPARVFLYELYKKATGQYPFDYVCVDDYGNKYMVDVTSLRERGRMPAKLSKRESQIAEQAKKEGFKILVPVVRFLENWQVQVELMET